MTEYVRRCGTGDSDARLADNARALLRIVGLSMRRVALPLAAAVCALAPLVRSQPAGPRVAGPGGAGPGASLDSVCPSDMVHVRGSHCPEVDERCLRESDNGRRQCLEFARSSRCVGARRAMSFCVDRYEWPNVEGALPSVMVSFESAERACAARGKRLCDEHEWAFACSGEDLRPYPYGWVRDAQACTIDLFARAPDRRLLHATRLAVRAAEVDRVYMATPSGLRPRCRSSFGVFDLTGNVDEWVRARGPSERPSVLMGGFWGHVRNRCHAATRSHGPRFSYYQIGFRCCRAASVR